jgi:toxin ParE1/3/4
VPRRVPPVGLKRLEISAPAEADIDETIDHLNENAGLETALRFADKIDRDLQRLARIGHAGVSRDLISPGLRMMLLGQYCVYFRADEERICIIRFLHSARDIQSLSFSDPEPDDPAT